MNDHSVGEKKKRANLHSVGGILETVAVDVTVVVGIEDA